MTLKWQRLKIPWFDETAQFRAMCSDSDAYRIQILEMRFCIKWKANGPMPNKKETLQSLRTRVYVRMDICVYVFVYMHECMYVCRHACVYVRTYVRMYVCTRMYVCMYVRTYVLMYVCMYTCVCVCM